MNCLSFQPALAMRQEHSNCGESVGGCGPLLKVPCGAFGGDSCNYEAVNDQGFCQGCRGGGAQDTTGHAEGPDLTTMTGAPVSKSQNRNDPHHLFLPEPDQRIKAEIVPSAPSSAATAGTMAMPAPSVGEHLAVKLPGMGSKPSSAAIAGTKKTPAPSEGDYITVKLPGMSSKHIIAPASENLATFPSSPSRIVTIHRDGKPSVHEGSPEASAGTATKSPEAQNMRLLITALQIHWFNLCVMVTGSDEKHDSDTLCKITDLAWRLGMNYKLETKYRPLAAGSHDPSAHATCDASERRKAHLLITAMNKHWRSICHIVMESQNDFDREILGQIVTLASYLGSGRKPIVREEPHPQSMGIGQMRDQTGTAGVQERETPTERLNDIAVPTPLGGQFTTDKDVVISRNSSMSTKGTLHQALASAQARAVANASSPTSSMAAGDFSTEQCPTIPIKDAQWPQTSPEHPSDTNTLQSPPSLNTTVTTKDQLPETLVSAPPFTPFASDGSVQSPANENFRNARTRRDTKRGKMPRHVWTKAQVKAAADAFATAPLSVPVALEKTEYLGSSRRIWEAIQGASGKSERKGVDEDVDEIGGQGVDSGSEDEGHPSTVGYPNANEKSTGEPRGMPWGPDGEHFVHDQNATVSGSSSVERHNRRGERGGAKERKKKRKIALIAARAAEDNGCTHPISPASSGKAASLPSSDAMAPQATPPSSASNATHTTPDLNGEGESVADDADDTAMVKNETTRLTEAIDLLLHDRRTAGENEERATDEKKDGEAADTPRKRRRRQKRRPGKKNKRAAEAQAGLEAESAAPPSSSKIASQNAETLGTPQTPWENEGPWENEEGDPSAQATHGNEEGKPSTQAPHGNEESGSVNHQASHQGDASLLDIAPTPSSTENIEAEKPIKNPYEETWQSRRHRYRRGIADLKNNPLEAENGRRITTPSLLDTLGARPAAAAAKVDGGATAWDGGGEKSLSSAERAVQSGASNNKNGEMTNKGSIRLVVVDKPVEDWMAEANALIARLPRSFTEAQEMNVRAAQKLKHQSSLHIKESLNTTHLTPPSHHNTSQHHEPHKYETPEREPPALEVKKRTSKPHESKPSPLNRMGSVKSHARKIPRQQQVDQDEAWESASSDEAPDPVPAPQRTTRHTHPPITKTNDASPVQQALGTHQPSRYRIPQRRSEAPLPEAQQLQRETGMGTKHAYCDREDAKKQEAKKQNTERQDVDEPAKKTADIAERKADGSSPKPQAETSSKPSFLSRLFWPFGGSG